MSEEETSRPGEFGFIETYMAPLAADNDGALGLKDDAGLFTVPVGEQAVVTTDALIAGRHFLGIDPPDSVGAKALAVNLSDLASMGATPLGYTLILALPTDWSVDWATGFSAGLADMQQRHRIPLLGGDTVATDGPLSIGITAFGSVTAGCQIERSGADPGDDMWVSGSIGDAALALAITHADDKGLMTKPEYQFLLDRLRRPDPRLALGEALVGMASAAIDISDGLAADLKHLCQASATGAEIVLANVPLSDAARACIASGNYGLDTILGGGDDYELLFTAPPDAGGDVILAGENSDCPVTRIGFVNPKSEIRFLGPAGEKFEFAQTGWCHF